MLDSRLNPEEEPTWFSCEKCDTACHISEIPEDLPKCREDMSICSYCFGAMDVDDFACYDCQEDCDYRWCEYEDFSCYDCQED